MKPKYFVWLFNVFLLIMLTNCAPTSDSFTQMPEPPSATPTIAFLFPTPPNPTLTATPPLATLQPTPTTVQPSPTATSTLLPTPTETVITHGILAQFHLVYLWGEVQTISQNGQITAIHYEPHEINSPDEVAPNPSHSLSFSFSNYSDQIAYWSYEYPSTLWVSDIRLQNAHPAFVDRDGSYAPEDLLSTQDLRFFWSPDDQHLLIYSPNSDTPHLIYHLNSGEVEEWYWICDAVIRSSRTGHLALLCPLDLTKGQVSREGYAIIEWEGEVWFTSSLSSEVISQALPDGDKTIPWAFSPNGQQLAYFDPLDTTYSLLIMDNSGSITSLLSGSSILQPDQDLLAVGIESPYRYYAITNRFFRWSLDSQFLIAYTVDKEMNKCRPLIDSETGKSYTVPCLQIIDLFTQKIIWAEKDSMETLFLTEYDQQYMLLRSIDFSPDNQLIVVKGDYGGNHLLAIVDLKSLIAYQLNPLQYAQIYWGN